MVPMALAVGAITVTRRTERTKTTTRAASTVVITPSTARNRGVSGDFPDYERRLNFLVPVCVAGQLVA